MGKLTDWEKVSEKAIGSGGQSTVFLVRRPERKAAREKSFKTLRDLSAQGLNDKTALEFARASADIGRDDYPAELGALKMFTPRVPGALMVAGEGSGESFAEQQALGRMQNEIKVLREGRPGLLGLLDYNESENWIVTEYCARGTLEQHLSTYKGNAKLTLKSFYSLVQTVSRLHENKIVHRDIKPQNIFIGNADELLLGDFGIVFLPNQADRLSVTGESVGPRDFMPPWVLLDEKPRINPTFDVYMLGKVLWCMVTGRLRLHREDFRDHRFNVTALFPYDPNMHIINKILEKCVVADEGQCLSSAKDLVLMVGTFCEMLERGGQLWGPDIPKPCRICGNGFYRLDASGGAASPHAAFGLFQSKDNREDQISVFRAVPYACDKCGHVQFFKR